MHIIINSGEKNSVYMEYRNRKWLLLPQRDKPYEIIDITTAIDMQKTKIAEIDAIILQLK